MQAVVIVINTTSPTTVIQPSTNTSSTTGSSLVPPVTFSVSYDSVREMRNGEVVAEFQLLDSYIIRVSHSIFTSFCLKICYQFDYS